jgi:hypothetical protein
MAGVAEEPNGQNIISSGCQPTFSDAYSLKPLKRWKKLSTKQTLKCWLFKVEAR